jgi:predicted membrane-bound spermidine synthase
VQTDTFALGRRVGWLQTANILGCTLGTVLTSWLFFKFIGTAGTLKVLTLFGVVFILLAFCARPFKHSAYRILFASVVGFICVVALMAPGRSLLWSKLHGTTPDKIIVGEDGSGLCLLKADGRTPERTLLYVDGVNHSSLPYGRIHTFLGALPALLHPNPKEIAVIGLGSGDTAFSIGCREETTEITCFEVVAPQISILRELDQRKTYAALRSLLRDGRIKLDLTDGRLAIMQANKKYDIIEADALFPYSTYSGNLYSLEHFFLLRNRLKPGGMAVTWAPTMRTVRTFAKVFPHVLIFHFGPILVGSNEPIEFNLSRIWALLDTPFTRSYFEESGIDLETVKWHFTHSGISSITPAFNRSRLLDINTDLFPKDEYLLP